MKRTVLAQRKLPSYTRGEEQMNMITHIVGGGLSVLGMVLLLLRAAAGANPWCIAASALYGCSLIAVFTVSSVYHGLTPSYAKKVMQVVDHCTIYFLIAGSYTVILLGDLRTVYPEIAWGLFVFQWSCAALAAIFTAIDLKRYSVFSMICYIGMGWSVIPFWRQVLEVMTAPGFWLLLAGGIAYSVGSILYGLGKKRKWMHSIFHIFVNLGALLQYLSIILYVI